MKTKTLLTLILATMAISNAMAQRGIVKQDRNVASFAAITVTGGWDLIIQQGERQSVTIEVSEEDLDRTIVEVRNGTLHISSKSQNRIFSVFNSDDVTRRAYVTVTDLKKITASGGVDIDFNTPLHTDDFEVVLSGGTDLEDLTLHCSNFKGSFSGGCDTEIRFGSVESARVNVSGGCDVSASNLAARHADVNFSGAAGGSIRVSHRLDATVSGAAELVCYGNPQEVSERVDRSSSLKFR